MPPPSLSSWLPHTLSLLLSLMWSKAFPSDEHSCYRWHMPRAIHHLLIGTSVKDFLRAQCVAAAPIFIFPKGGRKYLKYFLSILGTLWVADISSYRRVQPSPYINWKKFCMWLHTSWAQRWFCSSVFSFDSSHIAGNIQDQFPDKGSVFLQYNSIWRPSNLFTRVLIVPQVWYLQVGIWKNRFCMLFWDPHVTPGTVCHVCRYTLQSEVQGTTPVQDKESRILTDSTYIGNNSRVIHIAYFSCLM